MKGERRKGGKGRKGRGEKRREAGKGKEDRRTDSK